MLFFGGIVENESSSITQNVAIQLEPHGRLIVVGYETSHQVKIRLDGILYRPVMQLNRSPMACAPYCFSAMKDKSDEGLGTAGCVKYCTPVQYMRQADGSMALSSCLCDILK